jgi:tRNA threonylcarbamoyladenosine biosynthesis protein TsaE
MKKIISKNEKETMKIGLLLSEKCQGGEVFSLSGELGSGKTSLVKGMAQGLKIKKEVTSPTFIICNIYKGEKNLIHIDAYRLENKEDLKNIAFFDYLKDPKNIIAIEWGNKIEKYLPKKTKKIKLSYLNEKERKIIIS